MNNPRTTHPSLGIIIPCYNEEEVIPQLIESLDRFAEKIPYEVYFLFLDDGSHDKTFIMLQEACEKDPRKACLKFSRNFGHQTAVTAGLAFIRGDVIGIIDADLQDPPEVMTAMIEKWRDGYDVVYGIRRNRKEGPFLRFAYAVFYKILKKMANIDIPLDSGDFCIMDRRVVDEINRMPEHTRFIRGMRGWVGFKQVGFEYERDARAAGQPKYNLSRLFKLAFDGIVSFSTIPLRLASMLGFVAASLGVIYFVYAMIQKLVEGTSPHGWASTVAVIIFFGGVQLLVLGIVGEYLGRIFDEVKNRPNFIVWKQCGWVKSANNSENHSSTI